jgi:uncharacterized protein with HEPN domain
MSAPRDDSVYLNHIRDSIRRVASYHKLVHDCMGVDLEAVWETAVRDLPALQAELEKM